MTDTSTKNFWIVDLDKYKPVLLTADGNRILESGINLAEEKTDSAERLRRLVDFIRNSKRRVEDSSPELTSLLPFGVSHKVAQQIVYLAYWKNYRLEFRLDKASDDVVVWARFPDNPELNCVLDQFIDAFDPYAQLRGWLDFFCGIISDHAEIWQIHLVVNEDIYKSLAGPDHASVFIQSQSGDVTLMDDGLPRLPDAST